MSASRKSLSITVRLAVLFAGVAVITFSLVGTFLYRALDFQLEKRDDKDIIGKVTQVRHLLAHVREPELLKQSSDAFRDVVVGHAGMNLTILNSNGTLLFDTDLTRRPLPELATVPPGQPVKESDVRDWNLADGSRRVASASGLMADSRDAVQIVISIDAQNRVELLNGYSRSLLTAIIIGAIVSALLGFAIVRIGLRPLKSVIDKTNLITTRRLSSRLIVADAPAELSELGGAFNAMLDRLEEGVDRLTQFSADLAHDLRTPINTLMMQTQVILSHPRNIDEYQSLLGSNLEEYDRLARLIENTLFLARAENARLALNLRRFNLPLEIERIQDYFTGIAEERKVTLHFKVDDVSLEADPVLFQRIVSNLLSNAIEHAPTGTCVTLSSSLNEKEIFIAVRDEGPGISPTHLAHIFERYYRADSVRNTAHQSTGLGLAIVRAIMRLHNGTVSVESESGRSTTFTLAFPRPK